MICSGTLMKIEHRSGDFTPDGETKAIAYDFHVYHVWDGENMREVRLPKDVTPEALPYTVGDDVEFDVSVPKGVRIFLQLPATKAA